MGEIARKVELLNEFGLAAESDNTACAKLLTKTDENNVDKVFYFVKADNSRTLYNPMGFIGESNLSGKKNGKPRWEFLEVDEEIFGFYKRFLETRNTLNLRHAQRKMIQL